MAFVCLAIIAGCVANQLGYYLSLKVKCTGLTQILQVDPS
jgi:hypothetical protein